MSGAIRWRRMSLQRSLQRLMCSSNQAEKAGLVVGVYKDRDKVVLTPSGQQFDASVKHQLSHLLPLSAVTGERGAGARIYYGLSSEFPCVAAVPLGKQDALQMDVAENVNQRKQNVREAVAEAVVALREVKCTHVTVDECCDPQSAAEGSSLALWRYDELKRPKKLPPSIISLQPSDGSRADWERGVGLAAGQNVARTLMEAPANRMTPSLFCERVSELMSDCGVEVLVRDRSWIEQQKMGAFLSVSRGSDEPPRFLELVYNGAGADKRPLSLVGKGVTFDSGGISLKPSASMDKMRADMGGAACVVGAVYAAARLRSAVNLHACVPLCENMPSGTATRPGDVVVASNGMSIQVDNTDAEGRLILADALIYAQKSKPAAIIDLATLTGAMAVALGSGATGVFTRSDDLWRRMEEAGAEAGDRVWRFPLWKHFTKKITECRLADLNNIGPDREAGACTAAAFLQEFVDADVPWMHMDIAGVMECKKGEIGYLPAGMSGRPTRTLAMFAETFYRS